MCARACVLELVELELEVGARTGFFKTRVELLDSILHCNEVIPLHP